jgi:hypothetical protein
MRGDFSGFDVVKDSNQPAAAMYVPYQPTLLPTNRSQLSRTRPVPMNHDVQISLRMPVTISSRFWR